MGIHSTKLRASAEGRTCTFQIPGICNHDAETTVLAHIRDETKGLSNKANDFSAAFACSACHEHFDQHRMTKADEAFYALRAMQRTHAWWFERGLLVVPVDTKRAKPSTKTVPRPSRGWFSTHSPIGIEDDADRD